VITDSAIQGEAEKYLQTHSFDPNQDGTAFAYQYEWSNANSGCVKTR
jgi:hypothetical protein